MTEQEKDKLLSMLCELVLKAVPAAHALAKYGGTLYTLYPDEKEGQFCGVFPYKSHVQLAFSQGVKLKDPTNILNGEGKFRRHINLKNSDDIDKKVLTRLLKEAAKLPN